MTRCGDFVNLLQSMFCDNVASLHRMRGLSRTVGVVFGWYDNFDLLVSTPDGRRETHAMAT